MKKRKIIALTLLVAFLCSLCIPGTWAIAGNEDNTPPATENKGMEISKTATPNDDDTYTITLEAYATGEKISTEVTKDVPTDIILVLDQSGSMAKEDFPSAGETTYEPYTEYYTRNSNLYSKRHNNNENNGNLYYDLGDGVYATVGVTRTQGESSYTYTQCGSNWLNDQSATWSDPDPDDYRKYTNNLYVKDGEEYKKVTLSRQGTEYPLLWGGTYESAPYTYTYTFPDGSIITSEGSEKSPDFGEKGPLYYLSGSTTGEYTYTYFYTDAEGNEKVIGTSTGDYTQFTDETLYYRNVTNGGNITRLQALKNAVTQFESSVAQKAAGKDGKLGTADDVDHRIAVVGFASGTWYSGKDYNYGNTEVFVGANQYKYGTFAEGQYGNALQSMKNSQGQSNVQASINALDADGGTLTNLGLEMANGILDANPVPTGEKRNRVVIVFTDGTPGWNDYEANVANNAITQANTARSKGANVYSVGIFNGADATSAGNRNDSDTQKANWFMQNLSDNKGTPQTPSYYLSASDSSTLNNIFEQISDQIQEGGSAIDLGSEAVIKDVISPQFELPVGATAKDITLETYSYTGEGQWGKNNDAMGATAVVNGDQVSVTGFDFAENWCGTETQNGATTYRGNKLVISFPVKAKDGFLGGNGVYTNTSAGVYENNSADEPLFTFERPQVDVPIKDITVEVEDKNVYLTGSLTEDQLKAGTVLKFGDKEIDLSKEKPYGLEPWQTEYVTIAMGNVKDKGGNVISENLNNLTEDQKYTVTVDITPTTEGKETAKSCSGDGNINVFKPELTYKDSEVYYGDNVPTDFIGNLAETKWFHKKVDNTIEYSDGVTMVVNQAPDLTIEYVVDITKIKDNKINTKQDVPVKVNTVKIGTQDVKNSTTFVHQPCNPACGWNETLLDGDPAFLLHPQTCQLTVCKTGGAAGEPYVFNVYKDGDTNKPYTQVTIVGNDKETIYELPVGTYTIQEDTGWSWRYRGNNGDAAVLSATNPTGEITCTNSKNDNKWLNGYSTVVKNIFGVSHNN